MRGLPTYLLGILAAAAYVVVIGVAAPALASTRSTEAVIGGFLLLLALPIVFVSLYRWWMRTREGRKIARECFWKACSNRARCMEFGSCVAIYQSQHKDEIFGIKPGPSDDVQKEDATRIEGRDER